VTGWKSLSPATIWSTGWVIAKGTTRIAGPLKVCPIALVMWEACCAATIATVLGSAAISGVTARSQTRWRMKPA
jgi:hypothetical protein